MPPQPKVLIVGAGPTGLTLAICLLRNGISVRLIDRLSDYHGGARGTCLQPRTLELLLALGVLDQVRARSVPPYQMRAYAPDGKTPIKTWDWTATLDRDPSIPFLEPIQCSQADTESVLRSKLEELGGTVEQGAELVEIEQLPDVINASVVICSQDPPLRQTVSADWVVGADGARGIVRKLAGVNFLGETREDELSLAANVEATGVDHVHWHMWGSFSTAAVGLKPLGSPGMFQLQTGGPEANVSAVHDLKTLKSHFARISGNNDIVIKNASWISEYKPQIRMVDTFRQGRLFFAGDSAHCHPPTGGQGLNTSLMDAANLAWKLALVIKGVSPVILLDTYNSERMPVIATMLDLAAKLHVNTFAAKPKSEDDKRAGWGKDAMWRPKKLLMLGINYRWSSIVFDDRDLGSVLDGDDPYESIGNLRAGDRAPDAPGLVDGGKEFTLFEMLNLEHHTLLLFSPSAPYSTLPSQIINYAELGVFKTIVVLREPVSSNVQSSHDLRLVLDPEGHAYVAYGVKQDKPTLVVIRPDGFIGAYVYTVEGIQKYFTGICRVNQFDQS